MTIAVDLGRKATKQKLFIARVVGIILITRIYHECEGRIEKSVQRMTLANRNNDNSWSILQEDKK